MSDQQGKPKRNEWEVTYGIDPERRERVNERINDRIWELIQSRFYSYAIQIVHSAEGVIPFAHYKIVMVPMMARFPSEAILKPALVIAYRPIDYDIIDEPEGEDYPVIEDFLDEHELIVALPEPNMVRDVVDIVAGDDFFFDIEHGRVAFLEELE